MRKRERWELLNFLTSRHRTERFVGSPWSRDALLLAPFLGWLNTRPTALSAVRVVWYAPLSKPGSLPDTPADPQTRHEPGEQLHMRSPFPARIASVWLWTQQCE